MNPWQIKSRSFALVATLVCLVTFGCSGTTTGESGDGDSTGDGDAMGDGDVVGDGDASGGGGTVGDGDVVACTDLYAYGLSVTVIGGGIDPGAGTGFLIPPPGGDGDVPEPQPTCYATVTAIDGAYEEVLECFVIGTDCQCMGAGERAGTYKVVATIGAATEEQEVTVTADECHVQGESLTFFEVE